MRSLKLAPTAGVSHLAAASSEKKAAVEVATCF